MEQSERTTCLISSLHFKLFIINVCLLIFWTDLRFQHNTCVFVCVCVFLFVRPPWPFHHPPPPALLCSGFNILQVDEAWRGDFSPHSAGGVNRGLPSFVRQPFDVEMKAG